MPVFRQSAPAPAWCEVTSFEIIEIGQFETTSIRRKAPRELLVATYGTGEVRIGDRLNVLREPQFLAIPDEVDEVRLAGTSRPVQFVRFCGQWGPEVFGCGTFRVSFAERSIFVGDPVTYPKTTSFDSHYHDYDEYFVILEGSGTVVIGDASYRVRPGDCIPLGAGHHHDIPLIDAPLKAAYFETTGFGQKRLGHLWNYAHGQAVPQPGRV